MNKKIMFKVLFPLLAMVSIHVAVGCMASSAGSESKRADTNSVEVVLERLKKQTAELKTYQSRVEYKFSQPLLESETLRKGVLYYQRSRGKSALRMDFLTLKQDEEEEHKYTVEYIFDGIWFTIIDYQIKEVKRYQKAEPNEPVDACELVSENFPIIGFGKVEDLKKEFEIGLVGSTSSPQVEQEKEHAPVFSTRAGIQNFIQLHLKVKADSIYKDDYTTIDFWIDKKLYLPAKIVAVSTEEDIYEIKFLQPVVNKKIDEKVFEFKIPQGFNVEVEPLKKNKKEMTGS